MTKSARGNRRSYIACVACVTKARTEKALRIGSLYLYTRDSIAANLPYSVYRAGPAIGLFIAVGRNEREPGQLSGSSAVFQGTGSTVRVAGIKYNSA